MAKLTSIEWSNSTINGSSGCDGCELWYANTRSCFAGRLHEQRLALTHPELYAPSFDEVRMIPGRFQRAANWGPLTAAECKDKPWFEGRPRHIFVGDMGDFLSRAVTDEYLERELLGAITSKNGRRHVWQLLTKHPARLARLSKKWGGLPDNVIAMTTVTNQVTADRRIPDLLLVRCKWRGLSIEPLVAAVDISQIRNDDVLMFPLSGEVIGDGMNEPTPLRYGGIHWVICGGESGPKARPMHPDWARSLRDQCATAGVPFFFKQWGEWLAWDFHSWNPNDFERHIFGEEPNDEVVSRVGKKAAGRLLDGIEHNGFPEVRP